jgi:putative endonuclease
MGQYCVYILSNYSRLTLYAGMTNDLERRLYEHRNKVINGFTIRYHTDRQMYFEGFGYVNDALAREKEIKAWRRAKKNALIQGLSPEWRDLSGDVLNDDYGNA